ncbi:MAG: universal stress protein [Flavobacteriaceae bacterium]
MKTVCIALDASPSAEKIAKQGFDYAKAINAEIILIHVTYDTAFYTYDYDPIMGYNGFLIQNSVMLEKDLQHEAELFLKSTATFLGHPDTKTNVLIGVDAGHEILSFLENNKIDILVMGTHSHSILENVLLGNTATKIIKHSKIPTLVIPVKD